MIYVALESGHTQSKMERISVKRSVTNDTDSDRNDDTADMSVTPSPTRDDSPVKKPNEFVDEIYNKSKILVKIYNSTDINRLY